MNSAEVNAMAISLCLLFMCLHACLNQIKASWPISLQIHAAAALTITDVSRLRGLTCTSCIADYTTYKSITRSGTDDPPD